MSLLSKSDLELLNELKTLDDNTLLKGKDSSNIPYLKHVFKMYQKLFGVTCTSCPTMIPTYIKRIKDFKMDEKKEEIKSNYILKNGVVIQFRGTNQVYSNYNLTDKIAKKFLKENPNRKGLFVSIPEAKEEKTVLINEIEIGYDSALEMIKTIGIETKARSVKGLQKVIKELTEDQTKQLNDLLNED